MTNEEIYSTASRLDDGIKYKLLVNHHKPQSHVSTFQDGCKRSFKEHYYKDRPWLVYSEKLAGAFCISCVLFAGLNERKSLGVLVNQPFRRWARFSVIKSHCDKTYHIDAVVKSKEFVRSMTHPEKANISVVMNKQKQENIKRNREVLSHIVKVVLWLGRQGIAYRGHRENLADDSANRGNFLELISLLSQYDDKLAHHVEHCKKTSYMSPKIQNQIINIIGSEYIRPQLIQCVKDAKYYGIICDEATSAKSEYMSIVLRFVDSNCNIREEFMGFVKVVRTSGELLAEKIVSVLVDDYGLDIADCRGQGYDGAANMKSDRCGVQKIISEKAPQALYFHCASHCLNLVIVHACKDIHIKTAISKISEVSTKTFIQSMNQSYYCLLTVCMYVLGMLLLLICKAPGAINKCNEKEQWHSTCWTVSNPVVSKAHSVLTFL